MSICPDAIQTGHRPDQLLHEILLGASRPVRRGLPPELPQPGRPLPRLGQQRPAGQDCLSARWRQRDLRLQQVQRDDPRRSHSVLSPQDAESLQLHHSELHGPRHVWLSYHARKPGSRHPRGRGPSFPASDPRLQVQDPPEGGSPAPLLCSPPQPAHPDPPALPPPQTQRLLSAR
ncbi:hypothetical protein OJ253_2894, partial [Cryptosporidium canis]